MALSSAEQHFKMPQNVYIVCNISAWKIDQQKANQKSTGYSTVPCWHIVSLTCKGSLHYRWRNLGIPPEWLKDDPFFVSCWSCLLLIQLLMTSFVFPLALTGFSVGFTFLDAVFRKIMYWGVGGFFAVLEHSSSVTRNSFRWHRAVEMWGIPTSSVLPFYHIL